MRCGTARSRCTAASPEQDVSQAAVTPLPERSTHAALTICARNYFAQARVLAASFKAWHPEIDFHLVVVDRKDEAFAAAHPDLHITWVEDLGLAQLPQLRLRFDVIELCTNIKALCLRRLLRDYRSVVYLDPDTCVYARLDAVHQALSRQAIVLTPASLSPVLDGHRPDDIEWLRVGHRRWAALSRLVVCTLPCPWFSRHADGRLSGSEVDRPRARIFCRARGSA